MIATPKVDATAFIGLEIPPVGPALQQLARAAGLEVSAEGLIGPSLHCSVSEGYALLAYLVAADVGAAQYAHGYAAGLRDALRPALDVDSGASPPSLDVNAEPLRHALKALKEAQYALAAWGRGAAHSDYWRECSDVDVAVAALGLNA